MEEESLAVYLSMVNRGVALRRRNLSQEETLQNLGGLCNTISDRIEEGIEKQDIPKILHEVGNLV